MEQPTEDGLSLFSGCTEACGWVAAVVSAVAFGSFGVPLKTNAKVEVHPLVMQSYKTLVCFATCWFVLAAGETLHFSYWGILSGLFWVPGATCGIYGIRNAGLAVAVGTWSSIIVLTSFIFGLLVFHENVKNIWRTACAFSMLIVGLIGMAKYSEAPKLTAPPNSLQQLQLPKASFMSNLTSFIMNFSSSSTTTIKPKRTESSDQSIIPINKSGNQRNHRVVLDRSSNTAASSSTTAGGSNNSSNTQMGQSYLSPNNNIRGPRATNNNHTKIHSFEMEALLQKSSPSFDSQEDIIMHSSITASSSCNETTIPVSSSTNSSGKAHPKDTLVFPIYNGHAVVLSRRQAGILGAVINGTWGGMNLIPLHYAMLYEGLSGAGYLISYATGSLIVNTAMWAVYAVYNYYQLNDWTEAVQSLPKFHLRHLFWPGLCAGLLYSLGNFASMLAVAYLGQSTGYSLCMMQLFVSGLWGTFYFQEIKSTDVILKWFTAAAIAVIGIIWLSYEHEGADLGHR